MNLPRHIPATEKRLIAMVGEKVHPAEMARRLGITRQALHQRLKRLQKQGKIATAGRQKCRTCGRPLPPTPAASEAARRVASGKGSPELARMGAKAAAAKVTRDSRGRFQGLDNGERAE